MLAQQWCPHDDKGQTGALQAAHSSLCSCLQAPLLLHLTAAEVHNLKLCLVNMPHKRIFLFMTCAFLIMTCSESQQTQDSLVQWLRSQCIDVFSAECTGAKHTQPQG